MTADGGRVDRDPLLGVPRARVRPPHRRRCGRRPLPHRGEASGSRRATSRTSSASEPPPARAPARPGVASLRDRAARAPCTARPPARRWLRRSGGAPEPPPAAAPHRRRPPGPLGRGRRRVSRDRRWRSGSRTCRPRGSEPAPRAARRRRDGVGGTRVADGVGVGVGVGRMLGLEPQLGLGWRGRVGATTPSAASGRRTARGPTHRDRAAAAAPQRARRGRGGRGPTPAFARRQRRDQPHRRTADGPAQRRRSSRPDPPRRRRLRGHSRAGVPAVQPPGRPMQGDGPRLGEVEQPIDAGAAGVPLERGDQRVGHRRREQPRASTASACRSAAMPTPSGPGRVAVLGSSSTGDPAAVRATAGSPRAPCTTPAACSSASAAARGTSTVTASPASSARAATRSASACGTSSSTATRSPFGAVPRSITRCR